MKDNSVKNISNSDNCVNDSNLFFSILHEYRIE